MTFDINALFDDPRFAQGLALFGASGQHNAGLIDAAKTMQHMKQLKAEREHQQRKFSLEQQEHESMKGYRAGQLEAQSAQTVTSRMNAEQVKRQNDAIEAAQKRDRAMLRNLAKDPRFSKFAPILEGMAGEGEQPAAPSMVPQSAPVGPPQAAPMSVQAPALEIPRGKYGTPVALLDGLAKTESSNNPIALGPIIGYKNGKPIRAEGMFQFLPDTRDMLRAEGVNFDPFKPKEARDAADYYLMKLNKQHGGDWNKTLAAYGGFKTKDPTNYIQKVMGGSNEKQAIAHAATQNATSAVNPFAESQELQELGGILSLMNPKYGQAFEMLSKGAQPQKVEGGGMYQTPGGMVRVPQTPEQVAEESRKAAAERRAAEDQNIQREDAEYKKTLRDAEEKKKAADLAKTQADVAEKTAEMKKKVDDMAKAKKTAHKLTDDMLGSLKKLEESGGTVSSGKGLFSNLPAAVQSSEFGQQIQRITGTENQAERDNIRTTKPLLLAALMQATGMGTRMLDNVKEFEAYQAAINDPKADIKVQRAALERMKMLLTGEIPMTVRQPDGSYKQMSLEQARESQPAEPTQKPERKFTVIR